LGEVERKKSLGLLKVPVDALPGLSYREGILASSCTTHWREAEKRESHERNPTRTVTRT